MALHTKSAIPALPIPARSRDAATGEAGTEGAILGSQISPGTRLQSLGNVTV